MVILMRIINTSVDEEVFFFHAAVGNYLFFTKGLLWDFLRDFVLCIARGSLLKFSRWKSGNCSYFTRKRTQSKEDKGKVDTWKKPALDVDFEKCDLREPDIFLSLKQRRVSLCASLGISPCGSRSGSILKVST